MHPEVTARRQRRVLLASLLGVFISLFPVLIIIAALPDIARDMSEGGVVAALGEAVSLPV